MIVVKKVLIPLGNGLPIRSSISTWEEVIGCFMLDWTATAHVLVDCLYAWLFLYQLWLLIVVEHTWIHLITHQIPVVNIMSRGEIADIDTPILLYEINLYETLLLLMLSFLKHIRLQVTNSTPHSTIHTTSIANDRNTIASHPSLSNVLLCLPWRRGSGLSTYCCLRRGGDSWVRVVEGSSTTAVVVEVDLR